MGFYANVHYSPSIGEEDLIASFRNDVEGIGTGRTLNEISEAFLSG